MSWRDHFDTVAPLGVKCSIPVGAQNELTVRAGMRTLAGDDPPITPAWVAADTDPSQYDVLGRGDYLEMVYRF